MLSPMRTPFRRRSLSIFRSAFAALVMLLPLVGPATPVLAAEDPPPYLYGWGTSGTDPGEFNQPRGVALDDEGNVYVVDSANCRIQKFDACGGYIAEFGSSGSGDDQFILPFDVAVDSSGDVWVSDYSNHCVKKFHDAGGNTYEYDDTVIGTPGTSGAGDGVLNVPWGITTDDDDNLYVADSGNHRIQKFDSSGTLVTMWGTPGSGDGQFNSPTEVAVDSDGNACVADNNNWRIQKFVWDPDAGGGAGAYVFDNQWASGDGGLWGLAVDSSGDVYVSDHGNDLIRKYDGAGTVLTSWGTSGSCDSCLDGPIGIAVHPDGRVFVADMNNSRIQVFGETRPWLTFLGSAAGEEGYDTVMDDCDNVYVVGYSAATWGDGEGTVSENPVRPYTSNGDAFVAKLNRNGELQWNTFLGGSGYDHGRGITVDNEGNVYVTGDSNVSWGAPVRPHQAYEDAFACKLNSDGELQWLTFLGGGVVGSGIGSDYGNAIAVDSTGSVFVGGSSQYTWQGTSAPVRSHTAGNDDGFVAALNSSGALQWNTFLGATGQDEVRDLTLDGSGNLYAAGTSAASWQGTSTPVRTHSGSNDGFAAMLNSSGALQWNTFLGGGSSDSAYGIVMDGDANLLLTGFSNATWQGDSDPILEYSSGSDAYAAMLDSTGALQWNTFLGGSDKDWGHGVAVDGSGNWYIVGETESAWGSPLREFQGGTDAFAVKLNGSGELQWNTFIGGSSYDYGEAIAADSVGNTCIVGKSMAGWGLPVRAYSADYDAFAVKLDSDGTAPPEPVTVEIDLAIGWNLISVPVVPEDPAVEAVFWDSVVVYTWDADGAVFVRVQAGGALTDVEPGRAYWVKVTDEHDGTLTVLGAPVTADEWTVHLYEGWNMIGGPYSATAISKNDLYDGGASALRPEQMYWWDPDSQYIDEDELEQGNGYWIAATGECDLVIQASS